MFLSRMCPVHLTFRVSINRPGLGTTLSQPCRLSFSLDEPVGSKETVAGSNLHTPNFIPKINYSHSILNLNIVLIMVI